MVPAALRYCLYCIAQSGQGKAQAILAYASGKIKLGKVAKTGPKRHAPSFIHLEGERTPQGSAEFPYTAEQVAEFLD